MIATSDRHMISGMLRHETPPTADGDGTGAPAAECGPAPERASPDPAASRPPWFARRLFPLIVTLGLLGMGMGASIWWGPAIMHKAEWSVPHDLWGTMVAAQRLARLNLSGLYTQPTGLITFPGAALVLAPLAAISNAAGLSLQVPGPQLPHPAEWLLAGPYLILLSAMAIFAADALAERLAVSRPKRALLALTSAVVLWNISVQWGHPEDAVAVGLFLYGVLALAGSGAGAASGPAGRDRPARHGRAAWLIGAAIAVQPLVLLPLPFVLMLIPPRRLPGFLTRAAAPAAVLLGIAAAANWSATFTAVTSQPNWPTVDHPSPWLFLAPDSGGGTVAAGPARLLAIAVACACALIVGRRWRTSRDTGLIGPETLTELLWWVALAFALRCAIESVMVAFYLWPALAVAMIAAARSWYREIAAFVPAAILTFVSQAAFGGTWSWWLPMVAGLGLTLFFARAFTPAPRKRPAGDPGRQVTSAGAAGAA